MNDFFEPPARRSISKTFLGDRVSTSQIIEQKIEIHDFEIAVGPKSGNKIAYCQIKFRGKWKLWWCEGFKIVRRLEQANRAMLPFRTIVGWDEEGKYLVFKKAK